ncbi:hypothetical protein ACHAPJ_009645 [Fusarium lateritium]
MASDETDACDHEFKDKMADGPAMIKLPPLGFFRVPQSPRLCPERVIGKETNISDLAHNETHERIAQSSGLPIALDFADVESEGASSPLCTKWRGLGHDMTPIVGMWADMVECLRVKGSSMTLDLFCQTLFKDWVCKDGSLADHALLQPELESIMLPDTWATQYPEAMIITSAFQFKD